VLASIETLPAIRRVLAANRAESLAELLERPAVELYQFFYPTLSYTELDGIREVLREGGWLRRTALAPDQIDELVASTWVEIGAHSIAHRYLPALPSREVRRQVLESCAVVAERVGQRVSEIAFSYPYGGVTPRARRLVSQRCIAGFTTTERPVSSLDSDALIPRLSLDERLAERLGIRPSRSAIALERTGIAIQPVRRLLREARRRLGSD
jgi:peptidoglycan/xylan/chitin deacetylase (PgdA/CDA1 family)